SGVAGVGSAGPVGRSGGGAAPPPSSPPGPSANPGPKQPSPPSSGSINGSGVRPSSSVVPSSTGNATAHATSPPVETALSSVAGDSLTGSGFESERPASGFAPVSASIGLRSAGPARVEAARGNMRRETSSESSGGSSEVSSGGSATSDVQSFGSAQ